MEFEIKPEEIAREELWAKWKLLEVELSRTKEIVQNPISIPAKQLCEWIDQQQEFMRNFSNLMLNTARFIAEVHLEKKGGE